MYVFYIIRIFQAYGFIFMLINVVQIYKGHRSISIIRTLYYIISKEAKLVTISTVVNVNMAYRNKLILPIKICIWGRLCHSLNKFKWLLDFPNYKMS